MDGRFSSIMGRTAVGSVFRFRVVNTKAKATVETVNHEEEVLMNAARVKAAEILACGLEGEEKKSMEGAWAFANLQTFILLS